MIPLLKSFFHELLYSPEAARVWLRSGLAWIAAAGAQVVAYPPEVVATWGVKDWALRFGIAALAGGALLLKAGDKNPPKAAP
jgi:hypothetical protein